MKIDLSIIIVNWNTRELLKQCLASIDYPVEIIVVDNGSTDGSSAMVAKEFSKKVVLIANEKNLGLAKGTNLGIKKSKGDYILFLNSDTVVKKKSIQIMLNFIKQHPEIGVLGPRLLNLDGSAQKSCFNEPSLMGAFMEYWLGRKNAFEKFVPKESKPKRVDAVLGAAMLTPSKIIKKIGYWNEKLPLYFEDLDWCRRIRQAGFEIIYLPEAEIIHYHAASTKKLGKKSYELLKTSSKIYHGLVKHYLINLILWSGQKWQKLKNCY